MRFFQKKTQRNSLSLLLILPLLLALVLVSGPAFAQQLPTRISNDIPSGANHIVMVQEGVPPADIYADTYNLMKIMDFQITASENTLEPSSLEDILDQEPLVFSAKKQVNDNLALWFTFNVDAVSGGGQLMSTVRYASNVDAPVSQWKQAKWTNGKAKSSFTDALDIIRHARYDAMDFKVKVVKQST